MPFESPNLDQRTFEQIVTEIRRRIPTFTPEWTDLNDSDPGITLAQLFAFMTEHLLFQVNQVPEKGLITFLKMVGGERHPASPAVADVTLSLADPQSAAQQWYAVSAGLKVETSGPPPGDKSPVRFETVRSLSLLNGDLVDVVSIGCSRDVTSLATANANAAGSESFMPFPTGRMGEELYLVFDVNPPATKLDAGTIRLRVNRFDSKDVGEPPDLPEAGIEPRLKWAYATGDVTIGGTKTLSFTEFKPAFDSTAELTRSGYIGFRFGDSGAADFIRVDEDLDVAQFKNRFVLRAQLARSDAYLNEGLPQLHSIRLNTAPAYAVQSVTNELLGSSSGLPSQRFKLARTPVIPGSTTILVYPLGSTLAEDAEEWKECSDLFAEGPEERVYELFAATGEILFGDGRHGRIPAPDDGKARAGNSGAQGNIFAKTYQFGGGAKGNVGAKTLTNVMREEALPPLKATNVFAAAGGADEESTERALAVAPALVRSRYRAVSTEDFEALAKATPQVRVERALALANTRPGGAQGTQPGAVTVLLVPYAPFDTSKSGPIDLPSFVAAAVLRYLDQRRLVTTQVFVEPAVFRKVEVAVTLFLTPMAKIADTQNAVALALERFFHALEGGTDGQGWPFGGTIFFSQVFQQVLNVPGVARIEKLTISLDGATPVECQDVPLRPGELLYSGQHTVKAGVSR